MNYLLLKLIDFWQRAVQEPLDRRRRMATAAMVLSIPLILALWALSLRYSIFGYHNAGETAKLPIEEGKEALVVLQRGFANLRMISGELLQSMQNRHSRSENQEVDKDEKDESDIKTPPEELYQLPIVH